MGEFVKVEDGSKQHNYREQDNHRADDLIDKENAIVVEYSSHFVNEPCQTVPPNQCSKRNAQKTKAHFQWMVGYDKGKLGKQTHEEEDDERVWECDEESRHSIVD